MADCLSREEIEGLISGRMTPKARSRASAHLAECNQCRSLVDSTAPTVTVGASGTEQDGGEVEFSDLIEGFRILSQVGSGGQGVVYKAVQRATKRVVALKVLRKGEQATEKERYRFEQEIELVAGLEHPSIVTVYDSGVVDGKPYYAMQYVHGVPLNQHMRSRERGVEETLRLFLKVSEAVNHAHQRGIMHRDLKPGNVLIDGNGDPHILDFGLAKTAGTTLMRGERPMTMTGEFRGTLAYASPEQMQGDPRRVDMRTDVYSLGVLLYEMLTGELPYRTDGPISDVIRSIAEVEPRKPTECREEIGDEVETIVLKALAKDKERRYQTVEALGRDVERYLAGEPIDAKRDSGWYLLRMALRRHRVPAGAGAGLMVLLAGFAVVVGLQNQRISAERNAAEEARATEAESRARADWESYLAGIAAADAGLRVNETREAERRLARCSQGLRGWEWQYLNSKCDESQTVLRGHEGLVASVAFAHDGAHYLSAGWDGTIRKWDSASEEPVWLQRGDDGRVWSIATSPDGQWIVSGSGDSSVKLWDAETGELIRILEGHGGVVLTVAFSPDSRRIISGSLDQTVRVWDAVSGENLSTLGALGESVSTVSCGPDNKSIAAGMSSGTLKIWDTASGDAPLTIHELTGMGYSIWSIAFSPDGRVVASGGRDGVVRLWDAASGALLRALTGHDEEVLSVAFSPDGSLIASGSGDQTIRIWSAVAENPLLEAMGHERNVLRGHRGGISSVAFSPDGSRILSGSSDGTLRVWDARSSGSLYPGWDFYTGPIYLSGGGNTSVSFSTDGRRLAVGSHDGTVRVWSVMRRDLLHELEGHEGAVHSVAFGPNGRRIGSGSHDCTARIWDASTGEVQAIIRGHRRAVTSVAFSPGGEELATGSLDGTVRLWSSTSGEELRRLRGHEDAVLSVAFGPHGKYIASGSSDQTARVWDAVSGDALASLRGHQGRVSAVAFSPDGNRIVTGSGDGTLKMWDSSSGEMLGTLNGDGDEVLSVALSPKGDRIGSGSTDKTIRIWSAASGDPLLALRGLWAGATSVAFSPDGTAIVSAGAELRLWESGAARRIEDQARAR